MIDSLNSILYTGILTARSIIRNLKPNNTVTKEVHNNISVVEFKSLFAQIQAMAEFDNSSSFGKKLDVII